MAGNNKLGELSVGIGANIDELNKALNTAERNIRSFATGIDKIISDINGSFAKIKVGPEGKGFSKVAQDFEKFVTALNQIPTKIESTSKDVAQETSRLAEVLRRLNTPMREANTAMRTLAGGIGRLGTASSKLPVITDQFKQFVSALNQMGGAVGANGTGKGTINNAFDQLATTLQTKVHTANRMGANSFSLLKGKVNETSHGLSGLINALTGLDIPIGKMIGRVALVNNIWKLWSAVVREVNQGVQTVIDVSQGLANIQAITLAYGKEFENIQRQLRITMQSSVFTAKELTDAYVILGQAGFSSTETTEAFEAVLRLATASMSSLSESANILTTILRTYAIDASESLEVTNQLVAATNLSKLSIEGLNTALNFAGPAAAEANLSLEETLAALSLMADRGIKASTQGTGLRQVLAALLNPSAEFTDKLINLGVKLEDVNPLMTDFNTILLTLREAGFTAADAFEVLELRTAGAMNVFVTGADTYKRMTDTIKDSTAAFTAQLLQQRGLEAQFTILQNKIYDVFLGPRGLQGEMQVFIDLVTKLVDAFRDFIDFLRANTVYVDLFTKALAAAVGIQALRGVFSLITQVKALGKELKEVGQIALTAGQNIGTFTTQGGFVSNAQRGENFAARVTAKPQEGPIVAGAAGVTAGGTMAGLRVLGAGLTTALGTAMGIAGGILSIISLVVLGVGLWKAATSDVNDGVRSIAKNSKEIEETNKEIARLEGEIADAKAEYIGYGISTKEYKATQDLIEQKEKLVALEKERLELIAEQAKEDLRNITPDLLAERQALEDNQTKLFGRIETLRRLASIQNQSAAQQAETTEAQLALEELVGQKFADTATAISYAEFEYSNLSDKIETVNEKLKKQIPGLQTAIDQAKAQKAEYEATAKSAEANAGSIVRVTAEIEKLENAMKSMLDYLRQLPFEQKAYDDALRETSKALQDSLKDAARDPTDAVARTEQVLEQTRISREDLVADIQQTKSEMFDISAQGQKLLEGKGKFEEIFREVMSNQNKSLADILNETPAPELENLMALYSDYLRILAEQNGRLKAFDETLGQSSTSLGSVRAAQEQRQIDIFKGELRDAEQKLEQARSRNRAEQADIDQEVKRAKDMYMDAKEREVKQEELAARRTASEQTIIAAYSDAIIAKQGTLADIEALLADATYAKNHEAMEAYRSLRDEVAANIKQLEEDSNRVAENVQTLALDQAFSRMESNARTAFEVIKNLNKEIDAGSEAIKKQNAMYDAQIALLSAIKDLTVNERDAQALDLQIIEVERTKAIAEQLKLEELRTAAMKQYKAATDVVTTANKDALAYKQDAVDKAKQEQQSAVRTLRTLDDQNRTIENKLALLDIEAEKVNRINAAWRNMAQTVNDDFATNLTDVVFGDASASDALKNYTESIKDSFKAVFAETIKQKVVLLDKPFKGNMLELGATVIDVLGGAFDAVLGAARIETTFFSDLFGRFTGKTDPAATIDTSKMTPEMKSLDEISKNTKDSTQYLDEIADLIAKDTKQNRELRSSGDLGDSAGTVANAAYRKATAEEVAAGAKPGSMVFDLEGLKKSISEQAGALTVGIGSILASTIFTLEAGAKGVEKSLQTASKIMQGIAGIVAAIPVYGWIASAVLYAVSFILPMLGPDRGREYLKGSRNSNQRTFLAAGGENFLGFVPFSSNGGGKSGTTTIAQNSGPKKGTAMRDIGIMSGLMAVPIVGWIAAALFMIVRLFQVGFKGIKSMFDSMFGIGGGEWAAYEDYIKLSAQNNNIQLTPAKGSRARYEYATTRAFSNELVNRGNDPVKVEQLVRAMTAVEMVKAAAIKSNRTYEFAQSQVNGTLAEFLNLNYDLNKLDMNQISRDYQAQIGTFDRFLDVVNKVYGNFKEGKTRGFDLDVLRNSIQGAAELFAGQFPKGVNIARRALAELNQKGKVELEDLNSGISDLLNQVSEAANKITETPIKMVFDGESVEDALNDFNKQIDVFMKDTLVQNISNIISTSVIEQGFMTPILESITDLSEQFYNAEISSQQFGLSIQGLFRDNLLPNILTFKDILKETFSAFSGALGFPLESFPALFGGDRPVGYGLGFDTRLQKRRSFTEAFIGLTGVSQEITQMKGTERRLNDNTIALGTDLIPESSKQILVNNTYAEVVAQITIQAGKYDTTLNVADLKADELKSAIYSWMFRKQSFTMSALKKAPTGNIKSVTVASQTTTEGDKIAVTVVALDSNRERVVSVGLGGTPQGQSMYSDAVATARQRRTELLNQFVQDSGIKLEDLEIDADVLFNRSLSELTPEQLFQLLTQDKYQSIIDQRIDEVMEEITKMDGEVRAALRKVADNITTSDEFSAYYSAVRQAVDEGFVNEEQLQNLLDRGLEVLQRSVPNAIDVGAIFRNSLEDGLLNADLFSDVLDQELATFAKFGEGLNSAIGKALSGGSMAESVAAFTSTLKKSVGDAILEGLVNGFVNRVYIDQIFGPFLAGLNQRVDAYTQGFITIEDMMAFVRQEIPGVGTAITAAGTALEPIIETIYKLFSDTGLIDGYNSALNKQEELIRQQLDIAEKWDDILKQAREARSELLYGTDSPQQIRQQIADAQKDLAKQMGIFRSTADPTKRQDAASSAIGLIQNLFQLGNSAGDAGLADFQSSSAAFQVFTRALVAMLDEITNAAITGSSQLELLRRQVELLEVIAENTGINGKDGFTGGDPNAVGGRSAAERTARGIIDYETRQFKNEQDFRLSPEWNLLTAEQRQAYEDQWKISHDLANAQLQGIIGSIRAEQDTAYESERQFRRSAAYANMSEAQRKAWEADVLSQHRLWDAILEGIEQYNDEAVVERQRYRQREEQEPPPPADEATKNLTTATTNLDGTMTELIAVLRKAFKIDDQDVPPGGQASYLAGANMTYSTAAVGVYDELTSKIAEMQTSLFTRLMELVNTLYVTKVQQLVENFAYNGAVNITINGNMSPQTMQLLETEIEKVVLRSVRRGRIGTEVLRKG